MSIMEVETTRWKLVKDYEEYNAFVWTGLTLGQLYVLWTALRDQETFRGQVGDSISPVANDCLISLTHAIESAEAAGGRKPLFALR